MGSRESIEECIVRDDLQAERVAGDLAAPGSPAFPYRLGLDARQVSMPVMVIGEIVAIDDDGLTPMVVFPGQPGTAALRARTCVEVRPPDLGGEVALMFDGGDASRPIVMGVLTRARLPPALDACGQVEVDVDGHRVVVSAKEQLQLRCGKASITLTSAGKVLIEGSYLLSRSTGVNRVKGGSVQLN